MTSSFVRYNTLPSDQQATLVEVANVFRGYRLRPIGPEPAAEKIASLRLPSIRIASDANTSTISVVSVTSERDSKYSQSCWSKEAVKGSSPFVSVSVEAEQKSSSTFSSTSKKTYVTANYQFPRVIFRVDPHNLVPEVEFVKDVKDALGERDPRSQQIALAKVFDYWGYVIATHVEIGCSLMTTDIDTYHDEEKVADAEQSIKASLDAAVGKYSASSSASFGSASNSTEKSVDETKVGVIETKGGDPGLSKDIAGWLWTVSDPANWEIIHVVSVIPVTEILDEETQKRIADLPPPIVFGFPGRLDCWWSSPERIPAHITAPINLDLTSSFTISCWVKKGGITLPKTIISVECPGSNNSIFWLGHSDSWGAGIAMFISGSTTDGGIFRQANAITPCLMNRWQHVAFVIRINAFEEGEPLEDKFILYIDGNEEPNGSLSAGAGLINLPNPRICIGRRSYDSTKHDNWDGQIERVTVVQNALTQTQIAFEASQNRPDDTAYFQGPLF